MSDRMAVLVAAGAAAGALLAWAVPLPLALALVGAALAWRRPTLLCVAVVVLASCLGARAWAGVDLAVAEPFDGSITLMTDPEPFGPSVRAEARADGRRYEVWFRGGAAGTARPMLAGEGLEITGSITPRPDGASWLATRHVVGRLAVDDIRGSTPAAGAARVANRLRRAIVEGAAPLSPDERALLLGVLLGDDREQSAIVADDFRAAGLGHLLAVSGQNVAFVLVAVGPLLRRAGLSVRLVLTLLVLGGFALLTRFEPSVLRATTMAAIAATGVTLGRPAPALRNLALAVTALVLIDPLLVHSLGFALSVAASASILVLGPVLETRARGPRWFVEPLTVTVAAQVGVAPILLWAFGGLPVASVPANLLAGPAVAPLTIWGMTAGLVAGMLGGVGASVLHVPTRLLTGWLLGVARAATQLRLGELDVQGSLLVAIGLVAWWRCSQCTQGHWGRRATAGAVLVACVVPTVELRQPPPRLSQPADGVEVWRAGATVVLVGGASRPADALEGLRRAGLTTVDLLVLESAGRTGHETFGALADRYGPTTSWVPPGVSGGVSPGSGSQWVVGDLVLGVQVGPRSLGVSVQPVGGGDDPTGRAPQHRQGDAATRSPPLPDTALASARAPPTRPAPLRHRDAGPRDGHPESHARLVLRRGHVLRVRRVPPPGRASRRRRCRLPRRRRREGRSG